MQQQRSHTYPDDTRRLLLRTFVEQLAVATKICRQPHRNAAATKRATNTASSNTDDDVILSAWVILSGAFVKKKEESYNKRKRNI